MFPELDPVRQRNMWKHVEPQGAPRYGRLIEVPSRMTTTITTRRRTVLSWLIEATALSPHHVSIVSGIPWTTVRDYAQSRARLMRPGTAQRFARWLRYRGYIPEDELRDDSTARVLRLSRTAARSMAAAFRLARAPAPGRNS